MMVSKSITKTFQISFKTTFIVSLLNFVPYLHLNAETIFLKSNSSKNSQIKTFHDSDNSVHLSIELNNFQREIENHFNKNLNQNEEFSKLQVKQLPNTDTIGGPNLPYYSMLLVSNDKSLKESPIIEITKNSSESLKGITPYPNQNKPYRCGDASFNKAANIWQFDNEIYKKAYDEMKQDYKLIELGDFKNKKIFKLDIYPFRYDEITKKLEVISSMDISIENAEQFSLEKAIEEKDINNRLMIVTPKKWVNTLNEFIEWKKDLGFDVVVVELESIPVIAPAISVNSAAIKEFFLKEYIKKAYSFAIVVGDENNFPTNFVKTNSSSKTPSDLAYFQMGTLDIIPDVFYGRFPATSEQDIINLTKKIIAYEKYDYFDDTRTMNHVGLASNEGSSPSDEDYIKMMVDPIVTTYQTTPRFFLQNNADSTATNLTQEFSDGISWLNYIGHGTGTAWPSMKASYNVFHIRTMSPATVKPVIIDVACQNGRFVKGKLGERFINEINSTAIRSTTGSLDESNTIGAVSYYGGSVNVSWDPPAIMAIGINKAVASTNYPYLGESLLQGHLYLMTQRSDMTQIEDNFKWYHLQGDPSLLVRLGEVKDLNVAVNAENNTMKLTDDVGAVSNAKVVFKIQKANDASLSYITLVSDDFGEVSLDQLNSDESISYSIIHPSHRLLQGNL